PIAQTGQRGIIDWQSFSIGQGFAVNVTQPNANAILLNRVTGNDLSNIAGTMTATGRVFLVNPNGVLFTNTAVVNVGGLLASTLGMTTSDAQFLAGTEHFEFSQVGTALGQVDNQGGRITAAPGGTIALLGAIVSNTAGGQLVANGGTVGLVSGDTVTIDFAGDGLTNFKVSSGLYSNLLNNATIQADGGRVVLMATAASELGSGVVNSGGVLQANTLQARNGEIV